MLIGCVSDEGWGASSMSVANRYSSRALAWSRRVGWPVAALVAGCLFLGCEHTQGPALSVSVDPSSGTGADLVPTTANRELCCCRVEGVVTNQSTVAVHASVRFVAQANGRSEPLSAADFLENIGPGQTVRFSAPGLLVPCDDITSFALSDKDFCAPGPSGDPTSVSDRESGCSLRGFALPR